MLKQTGLSDRSVKGLTALQRCRLPAVNQVALQVYAQAYDNPIPGYGTKTVGNLRLFEATPVTEFNLTEFNEGAYDKAVLESRKANDISAVLYPNDATEYGKELRLKQQIFFVSASIQVHQADF